MRRHGHAGGRDEDRAVLPAPLGRDAGPDADVPVGSVANWSVIELARDSADAARQIVDVREHGRRLRRPHHRKKSGARQTNVAAGAPL